MHKDGKTRYLISVFIATALIWVVGCSGGSNESNNQNRDYSSYTGTALRLPASIQFGEVNTTAQTTSTNNTQSIAPLAATDPGTDYTTDPVEYFGIIEGNVALDVVNIYLCLLDNLSAYEKINDGPYKATLDSDVCDKEKENQTSSTSQIELTINSYRENNNTPHVIQLWFDSDFDIPAKLVGEFIVTESQSASHPYGLFSFRYSVYYDTNPDANIEDWQIADVANTNSKLGGNGLPRLEFNYDSDQLFRSDYPSVFSMASVTQLTELNLDSGQTRSHFFSEYYFQGDANPHLYESDEAAIFDADVVLSGSLDSNPSSTIQNQCYSRNTTYEEVWSYNLYYAEDDLANGRTAGQRVELSPGSQLDFTYTHSVVNDRNDIVIEENPITLYYAWDGYLYGFPYQDWVKKYNLIDGTVLTSNETVPVNYITKAVEVAEAPALVDPSECATLDVEPVFSNADIDPAALAAPQKPSVGLADWPQI